MFQALVAAGFGVGFLPRLALPRSPGGVIKRVAEAPARRILAVALPGIRSGATEAFLALVEQYPASYPALEEPARP
jgi:hypothetical protein